MCGEWYEQPWTDGANANSAVIVGVSPEDFGSSDILAGMAFQRKWEKLAYEEGRDLCRCSFLVISKRKSFREFWSGEA